MRTSRHPGELQFGDASEATVTVGNFGFVYLHIQCLEYGRNIQETHGECMHTHHYLINVSPNFVQLAVSPSPASLLMAKPWKVHLL